MFHFCLGGGGGRGGCFWVLVLIMCLLRLDLSICDFSYGFLEVS